MTVKLDTPRVDTSADAKCDAKCDAKYMNITKDKQEHATGTAKLDKAKAAAEQAAQKARALLPPTSKQNKRIQTEPYCIEILDVVVDRFCTDGIPREIHDIAGTILPAVLIQKQQKTNPDFITLTTKSKGHCAPTYTLHPTLLPDHCIHICFAFPNPLALRQQLCMMLFEKVYFPPKSEKNISFRMRWIHVIGAKFLLYSFPKGENNEYENSLQKCAQVFQLTKTRYAGHKTLTPSGIFHVPYANNIRFLLGENGFGTREVTKFDVLLKPESPLDQYFEKSELDYYNMHNEFITGFYQFDTHVEQDDKTLVQNMGNMSL